jgi:hypothetical protein
MFKAKGRPPCSQNKSVVRLQRCSWYRALCGHFWLQHIGYANKPIEILVLKGDGLGDCVADVAFEVQAVSNLRGDHETHEASMRVDASSMKDAGAMAVDKFQAEVKNTLDDLVSAIETSSPLLAERVEAQTLSGHRAYLLPRWKQHSVLTEIEA